MKRSNLQLANMALAAVMLLATGCRNLGYFCCADIPPGAVPQPLGTFACQWQNTHAALAEAGDFVIYQYEWIDKTSDLSPFGRRHVADLLPRLAESPVQLRIEPSDDDALDQRRQAALKRTLGAAGMGEELDRVVIGHGHEEPLYGVEAPLVAQGFLFSGSRGGARSSGSGTGGASAFGRGGSGGGSAISGGGNIGF